MAMKHLESKYDIIPYNVVFKNNKPLFNIKNVQNDIQFYRYKANKIGIPKGCPYSLSVSQNILRNEQIAIPTDSGDLYIFDQYSLYDDSEAVCYLRHEQPHLTAVRGCFWFNNDYYFCTYSCDCKVKIWEYESFTELYTFKEHTSDIKSVDYYKKNYHLLSSTSKDGTIKLWDIRQKPMIITSINNPHDSNNTKKRNNSKKIKNEISSITVNSAIFGNDGNTLYSIGESDNYLRIWDIRNIYAPHKKKVQPVTEILLSPTNRLQIVKMKISPDFMKLAFLSTNNKITILSIPHLLDGKNSKIFTIPESGYFANDISFSIDSNYLSVGQNNGDVSIINVKNYDEGIITLSDVHCDSIAGVSWSNRNMYNIYSISDDLLFCSHEI